MLALRTDGRSRGCRDEEATRGSRRDLTRLEPSEKYGIHGFQFGQCAPLLVVRLLLFTLKATDGPPSDGRGASTLLFGAAGGYLRKLCGHMALLTGPADGSGHLSEASTAWRRRWIDLLEACQLLGTCYDGIRRGHQSGRSAPTLNTFSCSVTCTESTGARPYTCAGGTRLTPCSRPPQRLRL